MKRTLSLFLTLCLLVGMWALPVAAEEAALPLSTDAFNQEVTYSCTDSNLTGWGLGFCFTLNAKISDSYEYKNAIVVPKATLEYEGETCTITRMGAVVTNQAAIAGDDAQMVRETAEGRSDIKDVRSAKAYRADTKSCSYAIRVVNIPYEKETVPLYARPYVEIEYEGEKVTLYGATDSASYADKMMEYSLKLPFYGTDIDGKGRLFVGDSSVIEQTLYLEIQDELDDWMTMFNPENPDVVYYACYDADGNELTSDDEDFGYFYIRDMGNSRASETVALPLLEGTAEVRITGAEIIYWTTWE